MTPPLWILEYVKRELTRRSEEGAKKAAEKAPAEAKPKKKGHASKPKRNDHASDVQVQETIRKLKDEQGFKEVVLPALGAAYFSQGDPRWARIPFPKWKKDPATGKLVAVYEFPKIEKDRATGKKHVVMEKDPATGEMRPVMVPRTLRGGGCGPTSLAIAIATLRPETGLTPEDVAAYAIENHYSGDIDSSGASMSMVKPLTEKYGLASTKIKNDAHKIDNLRAGLDDHGVAVVHVGPGVFNYPTGHPEKKPKGGHFIAVIGYAVDADNKEWFFVANPGKDGSIESLPEKGVIVDKDLVDHQGAGMVRVSRETLEGLMKESYMVTKP